MNAATVARTFLPSTLMLILSASLSLAQVPKKGGAQLDCQKLLTAAEAGQGLGLSDVTFVGDASTLYGNAEWAKNVSICAYGSKTTGVLLILEIWPTPLFDLSKVGPFKEVQPRDVSGLGAPAKLYTNKESAVLVVASGSRTLAVGTGWKGRDPSRGAADAVVAIAKLVLHRLPGR